MNFDTNSRFSCLNWLRRSAESPLLRERFTWNKLKHDSDAIEVAKQGTIFYGLLSGIWLMGRFHFSILWIFGLTGILVYRELGEVTREKAFKDHLKKDKKLNISSSKMDIDDCSTPKRTDSNHLQVPEIDLNKTSNSSSLEDFGLVDIGGETAEWINIMLKKLWPSIGQHVKNILKNDVEPMVQKMEPNTVFSGFHFTDIHMGVIAPRINVVKAYQSKQNKSGYKQIVMDMDLAFCSQDIQFNFSIMKMPVGIQDMIFKGTLRFEMSPLVPIPPFFGAITAGFLEAPLIDFNLTGLANLADLPGLRGMIHTTIDSVFSSMFVFPNKKVIQIIDSAGLSDLKLKPYDLVHPFAKGVLFAHVKRGQNLVPKDNFKVGGLKLRTGSSDPYVVVKVGSQEKRTRTIDKNLNPVWDENFSLLVSTPALQKISLHCWDDDSDQIVKSAPDSLGSFEVPINDIQPNSNVGNNWNLENTKSGSIEADFYWVPILNKGKHPEKCLQTITAITLECVNDIEAAIVTMYPNLHVSIDDESTFSVASHTEIDFQRNFYFHEKELLPGVVERKVSITSSSGIELATGTLSYDCSDYPSDISFYKHVRLEPVAGKKKKSMISCPVARIAVRVRRAEGEIKYQLCKSHDCK